MSGEATDKQRAFAYAYIETGNATEAYRRAYDVEKNAKDAWISVEACQLLDNPKVTLIINQVRDAAKRLSLYSIREAFEEYEMARQLAHSEGNPSAAVSAVSGKVKLFGLEAPSKQKTELTGKDGGALETKETGAGAEKLAALLETIAERSGTTGEPES